MYCLVLGNVTHRERGKAEIKETSWGCAELSSAVARVNFAYWFGKRYLSPTGADKYNSGKL